MNVKYQIKEFTPAQNQKGVHSFYAEAVVNQVLTMQDIAKRVGENTAFKQYEAQAILSAFVEELTKELLEGNAVQLTDQNGQTVVKFQPSVKGSMSDEQIKDITTRQHQQDSTIPVRTVAREDDVTPQLLTWRVSAEVGINYSKDFATRKHAVKVKTTSTEATTTTTPTTPSQEDEDERGV